MFNIGSALGNCVSGAIWTQVLVPTLLEQLPTPYDNATIAEGVYRTPFEYAEKYPIGTPLRDGMVASYQHIQRLLTITGICLCLPLIFFSLVIRDPVLGNEQSLPDAEQSTSGTHESEVDQNRFAGRIMELIHVRRPRL
jgi:SIT family siderophore-iron:H+ symporter-like MFS transporter